MIEIKQAILHILDLNSKIPVYSDVHLDQEIFPYLLNHLEKASRDAAAHSSKLGEINSIRQQLEQYRMGKNTFLEISRKIAEKLFQDLLLCGEEEMIDFVMIEMMHMEIPHLAILLYPNRLGYTHKISYNAKTQNNQIIQHYAILPGINQKINLFVFIDMENWTVHFLDKKRILDGEEVYLFPDRILNCTMPVSSRDTIKKVHKIVTKVAEEFGENPVQAVCSAKTVLLEVGQKTEKIAPEEVGRKVFEHHLGMQQSYQEQIVQASLPKETEIDRDYTVRTNKLHKIKTDTGIELTVPSDFFNNTDYIEFISNEDGTISINIKNIGQITNR